jgi:alpha 1,2-mannosyltransferase
MMQYDHFGDPTFVHYNLLKQIPSGVRRGFSWGRTKRQCLPSTVAGRVIVDGSLPLPSELPLFLGPRGEPETNKGALMERALQSADDAESPTFNDTVPRIRGFGDIDVDMLADANDLGWARAPATAEVRRRAATERGARINFHGLPSRSAASIQTSLC